LCCAGFVAWDARHVRLCAWLVLLSLGGCGESGSFGECVDGWCRCACLRTGASCQISVRLAGDIRSLSGTLRGSNVGAASNFGQVGKGVFGGVGVGVGGLSRRWPRVHYLWAAFGSGPV
jgi:hypothetical protein